MNGAKLSRVDLSKQAGLTKRSATKSSANLERVGVSEIGLKSLFTS